MRFSDWIFIEETVKSSPPEKSGVFQIKIEEGLLTYPSGKSAMFYYGFAENLRQGIDWFLRDVLPALQQNRGRLLIRWMAAGDTTTRFKNHLDTFLAKFGSLPIGNELLLGKKKEKVDSDS